MSKVYEYVTEKIIAQLEKGTIPWRCPWVSGGAPMNLISKKPYRGVNIFLTALQGFASPYWISRKQILAKGGRIRKGEKGTMIIFWKVGKREKGGDENSKPKNSFILRYYNVWNVEQTEGFEYPKPEKTDHDPIEACEAIMASYETCPPIKHEGGRACYSPIEDMITLPPKQYFKETEAYYSTLFHEAAHSTGHDSRLGRELSTYNGSASYSFEELVAEMSAAMLCGQAGIEMSTLENSAAYIANWLGKLKGDSKLVVKAAAKAQKAADMISGYKYEAKSPEPEDSKAGELVAATVAA